MTTRWSLAFLVLLALPLSARDWQQCPAAISLQTPETVYALGDTHGDYERLVALLVGGKLLAAGPAMPEQAVWSGGRATLVVTRAMIHKGDRSMQVIALMRALTASAAARRSSSPAT